ncbi:hypothetical protein WA158_000173 [Blastocystis sp. Blastoise]
MSLIDYKTIFREVHDEGVAKLYLFIANDIFLDCKELSEKQLKLKAIKCLVNEYIRDLSKDYLWFYEDLHFICLDTFKNPIRNNENSDLKNPFLYAEITFDESIDDEWFCVFLMKSITKEFPYLIGTIEDIDGNFILIEASQYIPEWLTPDTSKNRCFFFKGDYLYIPQTNSKSSFSIPSTLTIQESLQIITSPLEIPVNNSEINKCINNRIQGFTQHDYNIHNATMIIPYPLSVLFSKFPRLICYCCKSFLTRTAGETKEAEKYTYSHGFEHCQLTKHSIPKYYFVELLTSRYQTPKRAHDLINSVIHHFTENEDTERRIDIGQKLAIGFELFMNQYTKDQEETDNPHGNTSQQKISQNESFKQYKKYLNQLNSNNIIINNENQNQYIYDYINNYIHIPAASLFLDLKSNLSNIQTSSYEESTISHDYIEDLSWTEINETDFEEMLNSHGGNLTQEDIQEILRHEEEEEEEEEMKPEDADTILHSVKTFLNKESEFEGAEIPQSRVKENTIPQDNSESDTDDDSSSESDDDLCVDMNKVMNIIKGVQSSFIPSQEDNDEEFEEYMTQMDEELKQKEKKNPEDSRGDEDDDYKVVSNMLASIDAQGEVSGPAGNILNTMGVYVKPVVKKSQSEPKTKK